ncbi:hypothetical protein F4779DRAFT_628425 [Xylariaceae sp. FL0662B]|nr:hypothetical protein F4779DRAFT_628425 [Xylariaceae sp. FL0662B]
MTAQTFFPFARLPTELREQIWNYALQPTQPRAQFFTLFNLEPDETAVDSLSRSGVHFGHRDVALPSYKYGLAAPRGRGSTAPSWIDCNPSSYMFDSGLWDACRESREIIRKRHTLRNWWDLMEEHQAESWSIMQSHGPTPIDDIHTVGTFTAGGERRTLAISPRSDLLCLQPFDFDNISWDRVGDCVILFSLGVRHVALEYNPTWGVEAVRSQDLHWKARPGECFQDTKYQELGCVGGAATKSMLWARHLWFIDYGIHRSSGGAGHSENDRQVFYGMGCRFVEIRRGDPEWEISAQEGTTIYDFLDVLDSELNRYFYYGYGPHDDYDEWVEYPRYHNPEVGVLACEPWNS